MRKLVLLLSTIVFAISCAPKDDQQQQVLPSGVAVSINEANLHPLGDEVTFSVTSATDWVMTGIEEWLTITKKSGGSITNGVRIGAGSHSFTMSAKVNDTHWGKGEERGATITISSIDTEADYDIDNLMCETIVVKQPCPYLIVKTQTVEDKKAVELVSGESSSFVFPWNYTEQKPFYSADMVFVVESNTHWTVEYIGPVVDNLVERTVAEEYGMTKIAPKLMREDGRMTIGERDWLLSSDMGKYAEDSTGEYELRFLPASYNVTGVDRGVRLRITGPNDNNGVPLDVYDIELWQNNVRFIVDVEKEEIEDYTINFAPCYCDDVRVSIDSEVDWRISDKESWLTMTPMNPAGVNCDKNSVPTSFEVNINHSGCKEHANYSKEDITGVFVIEAMAGETALPIEITVNQEGYDFELLTDNSINPYSIDIANFDLSAVERTICSSGEWEVSEKPSWLSVSPMEGVGNVVRGGVNESVSIKAVGQNLNFNDNQGSVVFKSALNDMTFNVGVKQDKYLFDATISNPTIATMSTEPYSLNITSSGKWKAQIVYEGGDSDWLSLSKSSGEGDATITYRALAGNDNEFDRKATIVVSSETHYQAGIKVDDIKLGVTQLAYEFDVYPSPASLSMYYGPVSGNTTYKINIVCSDKWSIEKPDWIVATATSGVLNGQVGFTAKVNPDYVSRSGNIIVKSSYNDFTNQYVYNVYQDEFVFSVTPVLFENIAPVLDNHSFESVVTCSDVWDIVINGEATNWITASANGDKAVFNVAHNTTTEERTGTATIRSLTNNDSRTVTFKQNKFEWDSTPVSFVADVLDANQEKVTVVCSGDWSLKNTPSWVFCTPSSSKGNGEIVLNISNNYELNTRFSDDFKVYSNMNGLEKSISIAQKPFIFDTATVELDEYTALSPVQQKVNLGEIMSGWIMHNVPEWITPSITSGYAGGQTISFDAENNYDLSGKTAVIEIRSEYYGKNNKLCKKIEVKQKPFIFQTTALSHRFDDLNSLTTTTNLGRIMASWSADNVPEWLTVTPSVGGESTDSSISIEAAPNYQLVGREATLSINSEYVAQNPSLTRSYTVSQDAFEFNTTPTDLASFNPIDAPKVQKTEKKGSANWAVASKPDWMTVDLQLSGDTYTISFESQDNIEMSSRVGEVVINSEFYDKNNQLTRKFSVSQQAYEFDASDCDLVANAINGSVILNVVCSGEWSISNVPSWLTITTAGKGNMDLGLTLQNNYEMSDRVADLVLTSIPNGLTRNIRVTQKAFVYDTQAANIELAALSATKTLSISESDGAWSVSNVPDWLTVSPMAGSGSAVLTITAKDNVELADRFATFSINSEFVGHNALLTKSVSVSQKAYEFDGAAVALDKFAAVGATTKTIDLTKCTGGWKVSKPNWISVSPLSGKGSSTITIGVTNNVETTPRSGQVVISSTDNPSLTKVVSVEQDGYVFSVSTSSLNIGANDTAAHYVVVECSGNWNVSTDATWLTVGKSGNNISITAAANDTAVVRSATIVVTSTDNSSLTYIITITQNS